MGQSEERGLSTASEPSLSVCLCILLSILNGSCLATPWVYAPVANSGRLVKPGQNHDQGW